MVRPSRPWVAALALLIGYWPREAAAATGDAWGEPDPDLTEAAPPPPPPLASYARPLTTAYVLAPLLAIPTGAALFELTRNDTVAVVGAGLAVVSVPVVTHVAHGQAGRGGVTALLLPVFTLGALVVGGLSGALLGSASCDDSSDCELARGIGGAIFGALAGGLAGYVCYAIYDVSEHSSIEPSQASHSGVLLWASPVSGRTHHDPAGGTPVSGAVVGATFAF